MKKRVLFLCSGNSARSQIAEGLLRHLAGDRFEAFSAGLEPSGVNPLAIKVMEETGVDISRQRSKSAREFLGQSFDYVISLCDEARESCPVFPGKYEKLHWDLEDPAKAEGSYEEKFTALRVVRNKIKDNLLKFLNVPRDKETIIGNREFLWGSRTYVMGIVNLTPDSFSGDGLAGQLLQDALGQALRFEEEGADIIDVGGESTRPGSSPVTVEEELKRVMPLIEKLRGRVSLPVSIDTYKYEVARRALEEGASIINDVWGLKQEPRLAELAREKKAVLILMHNQKGTEYKDLISDIKDSLDWSVKKALEMGVPDENIVIDPGIGFGKTFQHNLEIMRRLDEFQVFKKPILLGTSRKSFIGLALNLPADQRLEGTAATLALGIAKGADIVRVHDVKAMARVCRMADAIIRQ